MPYQFSICCVVFGNVKPQIEGQVISPTLSSGSTMVIARSMTQSSMDVDPDESNEEDIPSIDADCNEDEIRKAQTLDTVKIIASMGLTSNDLCQMKIPLCRLVPMPIVRPTLFSDVTALEN